MRVLILHGPNLDLLGRRDPGLYGGRTLAELDAYLEEEGRRIGIDVECRQSNHEGELVDLLHRAGDHDGVVLNPGGFGHTSVALRDAVEAASTPVIEVHLSNLAAREPFRHRSVIAPVCAGQISGLGAESYVAALYVLARRAAQRD